MSNSKSRYSGTGIGVLWNRRLRFERLEPRCLLAAWEPIGPTSATLFDLERDPFDEERLYAGTNFGGVYQSTDAGVHWTHLPSAFSGDVIFDIATDRLQKGTVYVSTLDHGAHKSTNFGKDWVAINSGLPSNTVLSIAVDPVNSQNVLAATFEGIFRSTNGGATWKLSIGSLARLPGRQLLFDPSAAGLVYAGTSGLGVYRSTDHGMTWVSLTAGMGEQVITSLKIDPQEPGVVYASATNGVFRIRSGQNQWTNLTYNLPPEGIVNQVVPRMSDQGLLAAMNEGIYRLPSPTATQWQVWSTSAARLVESNANGSIVHVAGIFESLLATLDDGAHFFPVDSGIQNEFVGALAAITAGGNSIVYAGGAGGVDVTSEAFGGGDSPIWARAFESPGATFDVTPHPTNVGTLFIGHERAGVWKTTDFGDHWTHTSTGIVPARIVDLDHARTVDRTLYAGTSEGMFFSRDQGLTWQTNVADSPTPVTAVAADILRRKVAFYATSAGEVFRTFDAGQSFQFVWSELPEGDWFRKLASAGFHNLYAVTASGRLYTSDDLGVEFFPRGAEIKEEILSVATDHQDRSIAYAGTRTGGVYKTVDNAQHWTKVNQGITQLRIQSLAVDPNNASVVYAGSVGAIFKSTQKGNSWIRLSSGLPKAAVVDLTVTPGDSQVIYASVEDGGIYKSINGGQTWVRSAGGASFRGQIPVEASQSSKQVVFSGTHLKGVQRSANAGSTWSPSNSGMDLFVRSVEIDPRNPSNMYAGSLSSGVFKSTNGGASWANTGLSGRYIFHLAIDPLNPSNIYVGTDEGVVRTRNGGASWSDNQAIDFVYDVISDPRNASVVYVAGPAGQVFVSRDFGLGWQRVSEGLPPLTVLALAIDGTTGTLYAAVERDGIYRSINGGGLWTKTDDSVTGRALITDLFIDSRTRQVWAVAEDQGIFTSANGATWKRLTTGFVSPAASSIAFDPFVSGRIWASTLSETNTDRGLYVSTNGGLTWKEAATGIRSSTIFQVVASPHRQGELFAVAKDGVYRSIDGGLSWRLANAGLGLARSRVLMIDRFNPNVIYIGTEDQGVFRSTDSGQNWVPARFPVAGLNISGFAAGPVSGRVYAADLGHGLFTSIDLGKTWTGGTNPVLTRPAVLYLGIDPKTPSTVYAATGGQGVLKSTNGGLSWKASNQGLGSQFLLTFLVDPVNPQTLYAGTAGSGVFVSDNGGDNWSPLSDGLFNRTITSLAVDAKNHELIYAGTEGGGLFRLLRTATVARSSGVVTASAPSTQSPAFVSPQRLADLARHESTSVVLSSSPSQTNAAPLWVPPAAATRQQMRMGRGTSATAKTSELLAVTSAEVQASELGSKLELISASKMKFRPVDVFFAELEARLETLQ